ncbi:(d)CMP kinase [Desulforhopalus singaporensis]|uniref:Cytidylate kinase n=1 Tax=Desulforhopalus singaporensis TaxID=91360 RepID=A0A1H0V9X9_9BACT|nr:(d)CMP kinase [Desulforhopalus singaporensis]SDP75191.1 cytidylate kinase [Desulforhopalus singaporensis]
MSEKLIIVTIDGPAGVGKSTVSKKVAAATGFTYLDTGAMYRAVGLFFQEASVDLDNISQVREKLDMIEIELFPATDEDSDVGVRLCGEDVSEAIRTPEMAMVASKVSAIPVVREVLTKIQREYGTRGRIVAEGRDTGTVVFPLAAYKFFLDAEPRERAERRFRQLKARGEEADYQELLRMTIERDNNDRNRLVAPLKQADDAVLIDTTALDVEEVVKQILAIVNG